MTYWELFYIFSKPIGLTILGIAFCYFFIVFEAWLLSSAFKNFKSIKPAFSNTRTKDFNQNNDKDSASDASDD